MNFMAESSFNDCYSTAADTKRHVGLIIVHPELECVWKEGTAVHFNAVRRVKL
jgi:hypothetical protein